MTRPAARLGLCALLLAAPALEAQERPTQSRPISPLTPPQPLAGPGDPVPAPPAAPVLVPGPADAPGAEAVAANLARLFAPPPLPPLDQARVAGLPADSRPEVLTWERVYQLALIKARAEPPIRFEALDPARLAEQVQRLKLDDFARFRADFVAQRTFRDPAADFLDLQARLGGIAGALGHLAHNERWSQVLRELINGEASGLGQIDLDRADAATKAARREWIRQTAEYRDRLDQFQVSLGLAPRAAVILDPAPLAAFAAVNDATDRWSTSPKRELYELGVIIAQLPPLGDLVLGGRSLLAEVEGDQGHLAEVLDLAARFALGNRHDRAEPADAVELRVRRRVRRLVELRSHYLIEQQALVLAVRLLDASFERIIAPPAGAVGLATTAAANHLNYAHEVAEHRGRLVALWTTFQAERLAADRDLGLVIAPDWPTFLARFTAQPGQLQPESTPPAAPRLAPPALPAAPVAPPALPPPPPPGS